MIVITTELVLGVVWSYSDHEGGVGRKNVRSSGPNTQLSDRQQKIQPLSHESAFSITFNFFQVDILLFTRILSQFRGICPFSILFYNMIVSEFQYEIFKILLISLLLL